MASGGSAQALRAAGIGEEDGAEAREAAEAGAWEAALRFAERRKIGPFAAADADRPAREKAFAAMLRAGHPPGARAAHRGRPTGRNPASGHVLNTHGSQTAKSMIPSRSDLGGSGVA